MCDRGFPALLPSGRTLGPCLGLGSSIRARHNYSGKVIAFQTSFIAGRSEPRLASPSGLPGPCRHISRVRLRGVRCRTAVGCAGHRAKSDRSAWGHELLRWPSACPKPGWVSTERHAGHQAGIVVTVRLPGHDAWESGPTILRVLSFLRSSRSRRRLALPPRWGSPRTVGSTTRFRRTSATSGSRVCLRPERSRGLGAGGWRALAGSSLVWSARIGCSWLLRGGCNLACGGMAGNSGPGQRQSVEAVAGGDATRGTRWPSSRFWPGDAVDSRSQREPRGFVNGATRRRQKPPLVLACLARAAIHVGCARRVRRSGKPGPVVGRFVGRQRGFLGPSSGGL